MRTPSHPTSFISGFFGAALLALTSACAGGGECSLGPGEDPNQLPEQCESSVVVDEDEETGLQQVTRCQVTRTAAVDPMVSQSPTLPEDFDAPVWRWESTCVDGCCASVSGNGACDLASKGCETQCKLVVERMENDVWACEG